MVRISKERAKEAASNAKEDSIERFVNFITNPKIIQAFLTGSAFAIINIGVAVIANGAKGYGPPLPHINVTVRQLRFMMMVGVAAFWYWADNNQQRFKMLVEDVADTDADPQAEIERYVGGEEE